MKFDFEGITPLKNSVLNDDEWNQTVTACNTLRHQAVFEVINKMLLADGRRAFKSLRGFRQGLYWYMYRSGKYKRKKN